MTHTTLPSTPKSACSCFHKEYGDAQIQISRFQPEGGLAELHVVIQVSAKKNFAEQVKAQQQALEWLQQKDCAQGFRVVFARRFLSDIRNQVEAGIPSWKEGVLSTLQQAPLDGSKSALWAWLLPIEDSVWVQSGLYSGEYCHNGYRHLWHSDLAQAGTDAYRQTHDVFAAYQSLLASGGCNLAEHCLRTWLFVRDVDAQYGEIVEARKEFFADHGLRADTHYIASTGIEGRGYSLHSLLQMDAYALQGMASQQVDYLQALSHLNPTIQYGVTFERATRITYGDRRHILISGTASIDNRGAIVAPRDIAGQLLRTMENIEALLQNGDASLQDLLQMIVYVRDLGDAATVHDFFDTHYTGIPRVVVHAPVCRPGWLVEVEGIAATPHHDPRFRPF